MSEGNFVDAKKVALGGYLHHLKATFGATAAIEHRPDVPFWSGVWKVRHRRNIGCCVCDRGKEDDENQRDASMTQHALNSLIGININ
jgi:hypothetical protein